MDYLEESLKNLEELDLAKLKSRFLKFVKERRPSVEGDEAGTRYELVEQVHIAEEVRNAIAVLENAHNVLLCGIKPDSVQMQECVDAAVAQFMRDGKVRLLRQDTVRVERRTSGFERVNYTRVVSFDVPRALVIHSEEENGVDTDLDFTLKVLINGKLDGLILGDVTMSEVEEDDSEVVEVLHELVDGCAG